jgi:hypothetical protein
MTFEQAREQQHAWKHEEIQRAAEEIEDEWFDEDGICPWCGGDGIAEYLDCPEVWGEDCPSEPNHLIVCPQCRGSGNRSHCMVQ